KDGIRAAYQVSCSPATVNEYLDSVGSERITENEKLGKLVKRTGVRLADLVKLDTLKAHPYVVNLDSEKNSRFRADVLEQIEIELKYEGYIDRQIEQVQKFEQYESQRIPEGFEFNAVKALSTEGREKLAKVRPASLGQASRISGVTPSDVSVLMVYLKG
ncbi:MAG TPA: tRNA uridine-5-carboxymethylaminomethyl(34) synthesis enzyme MnmG, partial [Bacteroidota bacterium]